MLMTKPKLTYQARALLTIVRGAGGEWVTRSFIAERLDKNRLNRWDVKLLSNMAVYGLIEVRQVDTPGPIGYEWQYRAKEG